MKTKGGDVSDKYRRKKYLHVLEKKERTLGNDGVCYFDTQNMNCFFTKFKQACFIALLLSSSWCRSTKHFS